MAPRKRTARHTSPGPVRASIYLRMSLDRTGEGLGVERQERECRELCERLGFEVREVFTDNDISATKGRVRPGFEALLASDPQAIVVWHTDRLVRLAKELERVIDLDVDVHTVTAGGIDLSTDAGRLFARVVTNFAQYEGEQKATRQRSSARQRASAGKAWWSSRPFGYELDGTLRADEADALRQAYADLLAGTSLATIVRTLNDSGHLTCRGNAWRAVTLRPVLLNARNAAIRVYEGEEVGEASWSPIVDETTWRAAVALLEGKDRRKAGGFQAPRYLLTGFATCAACGGVVKVGWRGRKDAEGSYAIYTCRQGYCTSQPVDYVDGVVIREVTRLLKSPDYRDQWGTVASEERADATALRLEEASLRQRLETLAEDYADGVLTRAQLQSGSERAGQRLEEIEGALTREGQRQHLANYFDLEYAYKRLDDMTEEQRRALVATVLESVSLLPRRRGAPLSRESIVTTPRMPREVTA